MRLHREGFAPLALVIALVAVTGIIVSALLPRWMRVLWLAISLMLVTFFAQFFRSPRRQTPNCSRCIVSPADGTVVDVSPTFEGEFFGAERVKISIFMSVTSVHLNRVPVTGRITYYKYHPGKYLVAFHPKSSELNERNTTVIETAGGEQILVRQIAGILARRIRFYLAVGQQVSAGQELGFIRFGSRCDIFLPPGADVKIASGAKVKGGETILAVF